ncbi:unnamed protein product [Somion occarium]|uniref:Uncharacterized protein n=1 Tax=Somion occarium TaxID=3059160 RepID=A0ABP1E9J4_9APHY
MWNEKLFGTRFLTEIQHGPSEIDSSKSRGHVEAYAPVSTSLEGERESDTNGERCEEAKAESIDPESELAEKALSDGKKIGIGS